MKRILCAAALATATAFAAADVGISVSIGQPGFYGTIDIGNMRPQVIYAQPVVIQPALVVQEPIYLRVPPGHAKNWKKHCGAYNACGRPVYFVREDWYNNTYVPQHREHHDHDGGDRGHDNGKGHGKDRH
jgi:hypothetical protein